MLKNQGKATETVKPMGYFVLFCVFCAIALAHSAAFALDVPPLKGRVNDYANMMSPGIRTQLETVLRDFEKSDSTQVVILTIDSLEGDTIDQFGIRVGEAWKIGQKGKDNGVIFLVAKNDRKTRIEVGRGLEGKLTDLTAGRIIQLVINPQFKKGDFDAGFSSGVKAIIDATRGEFKAEGRGRGAGSKVKGRGGIMTALPFLIIGIIVIIFIGRMSRYAGGAVGLAGFPLIGFFAGFSLLVIVIMGIIGAVLGLFIPLLFGRSSGGGTHSDGGWGPGGGFIGSSGGGDFGGGGSSDDW